MAEGEYDAAFFKRLAKNDTPGASGHQGGVVIPKDLRRYFPPLNAANATPTVDEIISAEMIGPEGHLGRTTTRYQLQTWGGTRPPESRLTGNLKPLLANALADDFLTFARRRGTEDEYLLHLVPSGTPEGQGLAKLGRWGVVSSNDAPMTLAQLSQAEQQVLVQAGGPFLPAGQIRTLAHQTRVRRDDAFRLAVRRAYDFTCAVCRIGFKEGRSYEVEAAHIVPVGRGGADTLSNGLCLCQTHHWCFDHGLFWIDQQFRLQPGQAGSHTQNASLSPLVGQGLYLPPIGTDRPDPIAFDWHRTNVADLSI